MFMFLSTANGFISLCFWFSLPLSAGIPLSYYLHGEHFKPQPYKLFLTFPDKNIHTFLCTAEFSTSIKMKPGICDRTYLLTFLTLLAYKFFKGNEPDLNHLYLPSA